MFEIQSGLWDHMVLQRNHQAISDSPVAGSCDHKGPVLASVWREGKRLKGWNRRKVGQADGKRFSARLMGLPAGGPYTIELSAGEDHLCVEDVLVGDVWILAGQSNMQGCAAIADAPRPHEQVRAFYMTDRWGIAREPLHALWEAVDEVHGIIHGPQAKNTTHGVGPGMEFALEMRRQTGIPQGLIACAHGGTSMDQWKPALKRLGGKSLYGAMIRRVQKNGGNVAGMLWYQGESEAVRFQTIKYTPRMKQLISALRRDAGDAKLPVVVVQMGRYIAPEAWAAAWNEIQDQQRRLADLIPHLAVTPAVDLPLEDVVHIGRQGPRRLGMRMARAMRALKGDKTAGLPIELSSVTFKKRPPAGMLDVVVRFKNVQGKLHSAGYPMGFEVFDGGGIPVGYRTDLSGDRAIIHTYTPFGGAKNVSIHYGRGMNPAANVTDMVDQGVPAFGINPHRRKAVTPFVQRLRASNLQPSAGKLHELAYPSDLRDLNLRPRSFATEMIDNHGELEAQAPDDVLIWMACGFYASEAMKLAVLVGPDGPTKLWVDGKKILHYPKGTNPAVADSVASAPFKVEEGKHELLIAFGSNHGKAWGMFLRLQRLDLTPKELCSSPATWVLPVWIG